MAAYALPARINPVLWLTADTSGPVTPETRSARADAVKMAVARRLADEPRGPAIPVFSDRVAEPLPAPPYSLSERQCLAKAIYYEARTEPFEVHVAIGQVVMNLVRSKMDGSICSVVMEGADKGANCSFAFACGDNGVPRDDIAGWQAALYVADEVAAGRAFLRELNHATRYHLATAKATLQSTMQPVRRIGRYAFYQPFGERVDATFVDGVVHGWDERHEAALVIDQPERLGAMRPAAAASSKPLEAPSSSTASAQKPAVKVQTAPEAPSKLDAHSVFMRSDSH